MHLPADLGFELLRRDTPIRCFRIQATYFVNEVKPTVCCGRNFLIKLEAYTLIQHPTHRCVLLDLDVLVFKPDWIQIFDLMLDTSKNRDTSDQCWPKATASTGEYFLDQGLQCELPDARDKPT
jgi:hypothetical protein